MNHRYTPAPLPWTPTEPFDWATGGRALSDEEREHLRKLVLQDKRGEDVRQAEERPRMFYEQE